MSRYIDDAAEGSGSEADHEDDYDSNAEEDGDAAQGGFINDASSESGAEDEPGVRPRLSDEEMSDGEGARQYVAALRREKRSRSKLSDSQGGGGRAAGKRKMASDSDDDVGRAGGNTGKRKMASDSDDDSMHGEHDNGKRKMASDSDDDVGRAGGNTGKRKMASDSDDDSMHGEHDNGKRKMASDSDDDSMHGEHDNGKRKMASDSDDDSMHGEQDTDKQKMTKDSDDDAGPGKDSTAKRKSPDNSDSDDEGHAPSRRAAAATHSKEEDMQTDSGEEGHAPSRRDNMQTDSGGAGMGRELTQPTLLVGAYDRWCDKLLTCRAFPPETPASYVMQRTHHSESRLYKGTALRDHPWPVGAKLTKNTRPTATTTQTTWTPRWWTRTAVI